MGLLYHDRTHRSGAAEPFAWASSWPCLLKLPNKQANGKGKYQDGKQGNERAAEDHRNPERFIEHPETSFDVTDGAYPGIKRHEIHSR